MPYLSSADHQKELTDGEISAYRRNGSYRNDNDACSIRGADRLSQTIQDHWRKQGFEVYTRVGALRGNQQVIAFVRSDMIGGLPRSWKRAYTLRGRKAR